MILLLCLLVIPLIYCVVTFLICSFEEYSSKHKVIIDFPISSIIKEWFLQCVIFIMMPYEYFSRWEVYNGNKNTLVLMLPGYTETQFVFYEFRKCLKESDVSFKTIKYRPFLGDLDLEIEKLMVEIHSVISNNPEKEIVLIGHSMGGLIARCVLERLRDSNKVKSIMISTPHLGTKLASFALGSCGKQMRPKSCFINSMAKAFNKNSLNIYSNADSLVCPRSSLLYLGNNVQTKKKLLHNSILFDREVVQEINKFIDHGNN